MNGRFNSYLLCRSVSHGFRDGETVDCCNDDTSNCTVHVHFSVYFCTSIDIDILVWDNKVKQISPTQVQKSSISKWKQ